jgi:hypothetical protein
MVRETTASPAAGIITVVDARDVGAAVEAVETVKKKSATSTCTMCTCYCIYFSPMNG